MSEGLRALTPQDLDRLELFLNSESPHGWQPMPLDMLQGFLCGVASAPEIIPPEAWLPWALGIEDWPAARAQAADALADWSGLLERYYLQQIPALEAREDAALVFYEETPGVSNRFEHWCIGFLDGLEMADTSLAELGNPAEVDELLFPLRVLGDALEPAERAQFKPAQWKSLLEDCGEELWPAVIDTYRYGNALRHHGGTVRREAPKTGRNDPCHCGSGKKFKNCHGRAS